MYYPINLEILESLAKKSSSFILLDSAMAGNNLYSYLFVKPVKTIHAKTYDEVPGLLEEICKYSKKFWLCGYMLYEAAYGLEEHFKGLQQKTGNITRSSLPLGWFGVFKRPYIFNHRTGKWDRNIPMVTSRAASSISTKGLSSIALPQLVHTMDRDTYDNKISSIKKFIARGETYQVNFTYDVLAKSELPPFKLYSLLRREQPTQYCSFIQNEYGHVLSFSPELFFEINGRKITTKPMKGTAPRGRSPGEDRARLNKLSTSTKNSAENIMIVDLLRNDLGRICRKDSIKAQKLFEIETHPTLHQMTSTITGNLRRNVTLSDIIKSLFPCGSVTGAPKIHTMEIISSLEEGTRGVYCGMLGYVSPSPYTQGLGSPKNRSVFSVPIRILQKRLDKKDWQYRVGSGVVWNSKASLERRECITKCSFLESKQGKALQQDFEIFESMLWSEKFLYLKDHIIRLKNSARFFKYPYLQNRVDSIIKHIHKALSRKSSKSFKVRIFLNRKGTLRWDSVEIRKPKIAEKSNVFTSRMLINEKNQFLYHKTTHRPWYNAAMEKLKKGLCFDVVFYNSRGELTEGARSNIFVKQGGKLYTPPVRCGLLPGVLRKNLLKQKKCREKVLYINDLKKADAIFCGNSVRGLVEVGITSKTLRSGGS